MHKVLLCTLQIGGIREHIYSCARQIKPKDHKFSSSMDRAGLIGDALSTFIGQ